MAEKFTSECFFWCECCTDFSGSFDDSTGFPASMGYSCTAVQPLHPQQELRQHRRAKYVIQSDGNMTEKMIAVIKLQHLCL